MSLGAGFEYLMNSVARGDGAAPANESLTRYYLESGTPAGRFLGDGLAGLAAGAGVPAGSIVSEDALWRLLGMLADPVTGAPLGNRPQRMPLPLAQRIASRVDALPATLNDVERSAAILGIETEEQQRERTLRRPVAGFDLTFSVPKSVSVLWALAGADTQAVIHRAHRDAIDAALAWAERNIVFTRTGAGGLVQEEVRGLIAAAFDHWDSRAGDPHLHTHVVVTNRVQTTDGIWRSLDGATLFRFAVALSELHEGVLQDLLSERLGVTWTARERQHSVVPRHDIDGVPVALIDEFSTRSGAINAAADALIADFSTRHGRHPSQVETVKLRQQATLATRPDKQHRTLPEQMSGWRDRVAVHLDRHPTEWAGGVLDRADCAALDQERLGVEMRDEIARTALETVAAKRATFGPANVLAEVHRQLHGIRFTAPDERLAVAAAITRAALGSALPLEPADTIALPEHLIRADGTSKLRHRGADRYTTTTILDAETRLLDAGRNVTAPAVAADDIAHVSAELGADQIAAVTAIATSGRALDLLVGPAGAGKTTSLTALKEAWEDAHGEGTVIGLAPSAAAAQVLGDELGIGTENTAKWLHEAARQDDRLDRMAGLIDRIERETSSTGTVLARRLYAQLDAMHAEWARWEILPGQLVIVDEASLAGTVALDAIVESARAVDAKVLLVGDWAQLGAIDAGGAFHMLARDRTCVPELTTVRRFTHEWEADASRQLRDGDHAAIDTYLEHGRIHTGSRTDALHALFDAWRTDDERGVDSAMLALDDATVRDLNALAQAHRRDTGRVQNVEIPLADGQVAGIGDCIVTRRNDRRLTTDDRQQWVKNGDTWTIAVRHPDGAITAHSDRGERSVQLPAEYVTAHVELGYATIIHRAQGRTVDTAHALIDSRGTREALYVATTRGRDGNDIYVSTDRPFDVDADCDTAGHDLAVGVLEAVLARSATEAAAHAALPPDEQLARVEPFSLAAPSMRRDTFTPSSITTPHL